MSAQLSAFEKEAIRLARDQHNRAWQHDPGVRVQAGIGTLMSGPEKVVLLKELYAYLRRGYRLSNRPPAHYNPLPRFGLRHLPPTKAGP